MNLHVKVPVNASKDTIWKVISDIEHAENFIEGILDVKVLEKPQDGLVGFKWVETRSMYGKTATETMWITEAEENHFYQTRAENHGAIYESRVFISEEAGQNFINMEFKGEAQTFVGKIMAFIFGFLMKGSMKKMILQDLKDIKKEVESKP